MLKQINDNTYTFTLNKDKYEIFFADDGYIEIYDTNNPINTGFIFENIKKFIIFINTITDIMEKKAMEKNNE